MDFDKFISENLYALVPALWIIGTFLKRIPKVPDWTIVWALLGIGIAFAIAFIGLTPDAVLQGILVAGASVLGNQLLKQTKERE